MKIWIPGASGFVGKALKSRIDAVGTGREVDIADKEAIHVFVRENGFTHIVNCAAFSEVDPAESAGEEAFRINALGPEVLGRVAVARGVKLLHLSTDYVFNEMKKTPIREEALPNPCNVYGKTKLEGERRLLAVNGDACILRTSWIFGAEGKNFVAKLLSLLQSQEELRLVADQISRPTYVFDLVDAIVQLLGASGIFHFANKEATNKYEFSVAFREIAESLGFPIRCKRIIPVSSSEFSSPAKRPLYSALNTEKIEKRIPIRSWEECIREYLSAKTR